MKETIEEAARRYTESTSDNDFVRINSFIAGAKWQQEHGQKVGHDVQEQKMYSEEEARKMLSESFNATIEGYNITADEIIEQFKKQ
jgi:hypothetical protein